MDREVFRLRRLPDQIDKSHALQLISKALGLQPAAIQIYSLARSVDPWIPNNVATLMFQDTPDVRGVLERGTRPNVMKRDDEWYIKVDNVSNPLVMDKHFRGLTPLYDPASHDADCIALSGLASHPFGSWQPKGGPKTFMWIRDALPRFLPNVRPIIYGYDTALQGSTSFQTIFDLSLGFIQNLAAHGWSSLSCKPLVFVAHSLGGIVLKQTFVTLANRTPDAPILLSAQGVVFFGVPNSGMQQAELLSVVKGQPNSGLVSDLSLHSPYTRQLDQQFVGISALQDTLLYWGYETKESPTVVQDSKGALSRTGPMKILVTPDSATRGQHTWGKNTDTIFPINEDHSNLVKFSEDDPSLKVVLGKLIQILTSQQSIYTHTTEKVTPHLNAHVSTGSGYPQASLSASKQSDYKAILKSLRVSAEGGHQAGHLDSRIDQIEERFQNTFDWIFDRNDSKFCSWLQSDSSIFWINGKPGSGKSTLMKFISRDSRTSELLQGWRGDQIIQVSFFFHYRGTTLQKSFEGLLRSILAQLITQSPALLKFVEPFYDTGAIFKDRWSLRNLQKAFNKIIEQDEVTLRLCMFLDALDEYDGRPEFISKLLLDLGNITPTKHKRIKLCFSSRPLDIFLTSFQHCAGFSIQDFTRDDIRNYCLGSIEDEKLPSKIIETLVPSIVKRSEGVFLWVQLVVKSLANATRASPNDMSQSQCAKLLNSYPTELHDFYAEIIERIPLDHRWMTYVMLEITVRSVDILEPVEFLCALQASESDTFLEAYSMARKLLKAGRSPEDEIPLARQYAAKYGGGLVDLIVGSKTLLQVFHQTVQEFVMSPRFKGLVLGDRAKITTDNGNTFLAKGHLIAAQLGRNHSKESWQLWRRYSMLSEQTVGRSMKTFIDSVPSDSDLNIFRISVFENRIPFSAAHLPLAVSAHLYLYILDSIKQAPDLIRESRQPLLSYLVYKPFVLDQNAAQIARLILENGYKIDQDPDAFALVVGSMYSGRDIVDRDLEPGENPYFNIASCFVEFGQRLDVKINILVDGQSAQCTPLHISTLPLARLFLDNGAPVNGLDSFQRTPIDWLCLYDPYNSYSSTSLEVLMGPTWRGQMGSTWGGTVSINQRLFNRWADIHELMCLLVERGGRQKTTEPKSIKTILRRLAQEGLETAELRKKLLPKQSPEKRLEAPKLDESPVTHQPPSKHPEPAESNEIQSATKLPEDRLETEPSSNKPPKDRLETEPSIIKPLEERPEIKPLTNKPLPVRPKPTESGQGLLLGSRKLRKARDKCSVQ
ncbi:hypothetical protein F4777DRAFT_540280 [Nemania sp. FL0916]|nr:hypothetical protein F4777DRAFT_540280 [Nemania sp. FL0916]